MSESLEIVGKVLGVLGTLGSTILTGIKLYERCFKKPPGGEEDDESTGAARRPAADRDEPHRHGGGAWVGWGLAVALTFVLLGLGTLVVGARSGSRDVLDRPDAKKFQQARERLQFRDGVPISAKDLHKAMWDLMYSGIIQKEYGGKVILVTGPVNNVTDSLHCVWLEAGAFPATVSCSFGVRNHDRIKTLQKGQMVTIRAEIQTYQNGSGGEILNLVDCELVSAEAGGEKAFPKRPQ